MIYYEKFHISNLSFNFLPPTWEAISKGLSGVITKLLKSVLSAHIPHVNAKFGVCSSYGFRQTLYGHDIEEEERRDGHG